MTTLAYIYSGPPHPSVAGPLGVQGMIAWAAVCGWNGGMAPDRRAWLGCALGCIPGVTHLLGAFDAARDALRARRERGILGP